MKETQTCKIFFILLVGLMFASCGNDPAGQEDADFNTYMVSDAADIATILPELMAGDVVVLKNGEWHNQTISVSAIGTEEKPVVFRAETIGKVVLTGNSTIDIGGQYVTVQGLHLKDIIPPPMASSSENNHLVRALGNHILITQCAITGQGQPTNNTSRYMWMGIYGTDNTVSRCSFVDMTHWGNMLILWQRKGGGYIGHKVEDCYFYRPRAAVDEKGEKINGQEALRIGSGDPTSLSEASCIVKNNYFFQCNADEEIISCKSSGNLFEGNVFSQCQGALSLRSGNRNVVRNNWFFGEDIQSTAGVRAMGNEHRIENNYFQRLHRWGVALTKGGLGNDSWIPVAATNVIVKRNIFIDCPAALAVNIGNSDTSPLPVRNNRIEDNVFGNPFGSNFILMQLFSDPAPAAGTTLKNNTYDNGRVVGIGATEATIRKTPIVRPEIPPAVISSDRYGAGWK